MIDSINAGPDLDELVEIQVFGRPCPGTPVETEIPNSIVNEHCPACGRAWDLGASPTTHAAKKGDELPRYSTDDQTAFVALQQKAADETWCAVITCDFTKRDGSFTVNLDGETSAPTLALAICKAMLKATAGRNARV